MLHYHELMLHQQKSQKTLLLEVIPVIDHLLGLLANLHQ